MIWFLVFLVLTQITEIFSDCTITTEGLLNVLVVKPIYTDYVLSTTPKSVTIPSNGVIEIFCESEFSIRNYNNYELENYGHIMKLSCKSGSTYFNVDGQPNHPDSHRWKNDIKCYNFEIPFYSTKLDDCAFSGLQYGIEIKGTPIVLAEFCYNFDTSEFVYIHFVAGKRSSLLNQQLIYNPSHVDEISHKWKIFMQTKEYPIITLENKWKIFSPYAEKFTKDLEFQFHELVPRKLYASFLEQFTGDVDNTNMIPWWMSLKNGNWEMVQNIINKYSTKTILEIYAGRSGVALYPERFVCSSEYEMSFEFNNEEKYIPLYIWNYIIPRNDEILKKEFVLVAVNSPFFEDSMIICKDICEDIDWLEPLESTRKNPVFGYIFCCSPDEFANKLDGFPTLNVNKTSDFDYL